MKTATAQTTETIAAKAESLRILGIYAKEAGLDLNASSEQMFRVSPEALTKVQRLELLKMFLAATPPPSSHYHYCVECGDSINCYKTDCDHTEGECRKCHDGDLSMTRTERWLHNRQAVMQ